LGAQQTETALLKLWQEVLGPDVNSIDQNFFALGGHSLHALKLTHLIQRQFAVQTSFTMLYRAPTIRELANSLVNAAQFGISAIDELLTCLSPTKDLPPVFAFPPGTADALGYSQLAKALTDFTFYAFNFPEELSPISDYADLIIQTCPAGPYVLFGYSGGGNIAYRVASELESRGISVAVVCMLDSSRFYKTFTFPQEEPRRLATEFLSHDEVKACVKNHVLHDKVIRRIQNYYSFLSSQVESKEIKADVHVITSEGSPDKFHDASGDLLCSKSGWADVTSGHFYSHSGKGTHGEMLHQSCLHSNSRLIRDIVQKTLLY
jgi:thioesterase domain-containing protein/acyl carrier protein